MNGLDQLVVGVALGGGVVISTLILFALIKKFMQICQPNEILIISGRTRTLADGTQIGFRVITGGRAFVIPILETVNRMDARTIPVDISVTNAYSKGGIPLSVHAIANVKISTDPRIVNNAIERFLGRNPNEIKRVAKETLEGNIRGVLANLTPEEVNEDRLKFASALADDVEDDLARLGLHIDTLKIQNVADEVKYLDSIGREQIAIIRKQAEIAESDAKREADAAEAEARGRGSVAQAEAKAAIQQKQNELRQITADLDAQARSEEERAKAAAEAARAEAEQDLQEIRAALEKLRLEADVVLPAEAERTAQEHLARGEAAYALERGRAMASAQSLLAEAWREAGDQGLDIFLVQQIETLLSEVASVTRNIKINEASLIDSGDGKALSAYLSAYPGLVRMLLEEIRLTLGLDIAGSIRGEVISNSGSVVEPKPSAATRAPALPNPGPAAPWGGSPR